MLPALKCSDEMCRSDTAWVDCEPLQVRSWPEDFFNNSQLQPSCGLQASQTFQFYLHWAGLGFKMSSPLFYSLHIFTSENYIEVEDKKIINKIKILKPIPGKKGSSICPVCWCLRLTRLGQRERICSSLVDVDTWRSVRFDPNEERSGTRAERLN